MPKKSWWRPWNDNLLTSKLYLDTTNPPNACPSCQWVPRHGSVQSVPLNLIFISPTRAFKAVIPVLYLAVKYRLLVGRNPVQAPVQQFLVEKMQVFFSKLGLAVGSWLYCWWFRNLAITTWDGAKTLKIMGLNYQPQLGSRISEPSTVVYGYIIFGDIIVGCFKDYWQTFPLNMKTTLVLTNQTSVWRSKGHQPEILGNRSTFHKACRSSSSPLSNGHSIFSNKRYKQKQLDTCGT